MNTKILAKKIGAAVVTAGMAALVFGGVVAGPASADTPWQNRQEVQSNKNTMRNLGIGLGAAAVYEATQGKGTNALLLGAGAALAGAQYEKDRKQQDDHNWRRGDDYRFDDHARYDTRRDNALRFDDRRSDDHRYADRYDHR